MSKASTGDGYALGFFLFLGMLALSTGIGADLKVEGVTGHDLHLAELRCIPPGAEFEQELACFQAIYGGREK